MSTHTKEPWIVTGGERIKYVEARIGNGMLQEIASCMIVEHGNHEENARRIVACVNACAGIPTETLEMASSSIAVSQSLNGYLDMRKQRNELLAALKGIQDLMGFEWLLPEFDAARDAISKSESTK